MSDPIDSIKTVKRKWEKNWMDLKGVAGVGIGRLSAGGIGIIISIEKDSPQLREKLPSEVDGIKVEIQVSGPFRAL